MCVRLLDVLIKWDVNQKGLKLIYYLFILCLFCIYYLSCLLVWCDGKALDYRYDGHGFEPCHRHIRCVLLVKSA